MICDKLFTICGDLESLHCEFTRVFNMVKIFDEHLEESMEFLAESQDGFAKYAVDRYETLRSLLEVLEFRMGDALPEMRRQIDAAYSLWREANIKQTIIGEWPQPSPPVSAV